MPHLWAGFGFPCNIGPRDTQVSDTPASLGTAPDGSHIADLGQILPAGHGLVTAKSSRYRRIWLDTFDHRLAASGFTLYQQGAGRSARTFLVGPEGGVMAVFEGTLAKKMAGDLPKEMAKVIGKLLGLRALLEVGRAAVTVTSAAVVDELDKTICRLWIESAEGAGSRVSIVPLTGYQTEADLVCSAVAAAGLSWSQRPMWLDLPEGSRHGDPPLRPTLVPEERAGTAVARLLAHLFAQIELNAPGAIARHDTEFLHDLRVAVRRGRSALKLLSPLLPPDEIEPLAAELKWLGDVTTVARDLDVQLLQLPLVRSSLPSHWGNQLDPLADLLAHKRRQSHKKLAQHLSSERFWGLVGWDLGPLQAAEPDCGSLEDLAAGIIASAHRRVLRRGGQIGDDSPPESLHSLRKRCKELRYAIEFFSDLFDPAAVATAIKELKVLQDNLGEHQDAEVHAAMLAKLGEELYASDAGPGAILATGMAIAAMAERQAVARSGFHEYFVRFSRPAARAAFASLTGRPVR